MGQSGRTAAGNCGIICKSNDLELAKLELERGIAGGY